MVQATKDLWGELNLQASKETPIDLLKEQAYLLDEKTNNLLRGEILSRKVAFPGENQWHWFHVFNIVVPKLRNQRKELLRFIHSGNIYFPASLVVGYEEEMQEYKINSFIQFEKQLSEILSSRRTKELLQSLISA